MTINSNSMFSYSSVLNSNNKVHSQSGASGLKASDSTSALQQVEATALMSSLDTNQDNVIDKNELNQAIQNQNMDTNSNNLFKSLDKDKDGAISANELLSALQKSQNKQQTQANNSGQNPPPNNVASENTAKPNLQQVLLNKILSAYDNTSTINQSTTNISV